MKNIILILSFLFLISCIDYKEELNNFIKNGKRTQGVVINVSSNVHILYVVNGQEYKNCVKKQFFLVKTLPI
jgi:hypothetical protein